MKRAGSLGALLTLAACCSCSTDVTLAFFAPPREVEAPGAAGAGPQSCRELGEELCNAADDDCNDEIDEGCDHTIFWRPEPDGEFLGHPGDGVTFTQVCDTGSVISGLRVAFGKSLNQVGAICSQVGVTADTSQAVSTFSVTVGSSFAKALVPAVSPDPTNEIADLTCPEGLAVSMLEGDDDASLHILDLRLRCAPLLVGGEAPLALELDLSQEEILAPLACATCREPYEFTFASAVPPGHVGRRLFGGVGTLVNRFGIGTNVARVLNR